MSQLLAASRAAAESSLAVLNPENYQGKVLHLTMDRCIEKVSAKGKPYAIIGGAEGAAVVWGWSPLWSQLADTLGGSEPKDWFGNVVTLEGRRGANKMSYWHATFAPEIEEVDEDCPFDDAIPQM